MLYWLFMGEMSMNVQTILPYVQLLVSCGTFLGMLYALKRFIDKPHDDLVKRVTALEVKIKEHDIKHSEFVLKNFSKMCKIKIHI